MNQAIILPQPGDRVNFHHQKASQTMRGVYLGSESHPHMRHGTKTFAIIEVENQPFYTRHGVKGKVQIMCGHEDISSIIGQKKVVQ